MLIPPAVSADPPRRAVRGGWRSAILLLVAGLLLGATGYCWFLGYFGGPIYTLVQSKPERALPASRGTMAIYFSGDLGFNTGMGPKITRDLADHGIPVLGVNSLTLFAHQQSPAATEAIVSRAVDHALEVNGVTRLVLIGQSFGANALIEGARGLSPSQRAHISLIVPLTPSDITVLQATPGGVVDLGPTFPALPAARALNWRPVVCVQGQKESHGLCPQWQQSNVRMIALPGGHFLNDDTTLVARTILRAIQSTERLPHSA